MRKSEPQGVTVKSGHLSEAGVGAAGSAWGTGPSGSEPPGKWAAPRLKEPPQDTVPRRALPRPGPHHRGVVRVSPTCFILTRRLRPSVREEPTTRTFSASPPNSDGLPVRHCTAVTQAILSRASAHLEGSLLTSGRPPARPSRTELATQPALTARKALVGGGGP